MSELRTDSREWVQRIMGSLDRMLVGIESLAVGEYPIISWEVKSFIGRVILRKCFRKIIGKHI